MQPALLAQQAGRFYHEVELGQRTPITVRVFDQTGRVVAQPATNTADARIALPDDLAAGVYLVSVSGVANAPTLKMVVR